jgi:hypothetical protein
MSFPRIAFVESSFDQPQNGFGIGGNLAIKNAARHRERKPNRGRFSGMAKLLLELGKFLYHGSEARQHRLHAFGRLLGSGSQTGGISRLMGRLDALLNVR